MIDPLASTRTASTDTSVVVRAPGTHGDAGLASTPRGRIRQYELIREIGRGGMGTVYLARDTKLARRVAIKFLTDSSPPVAARFLVEARATARCIHENIVVIHEVDEIEGQPYMVLEYLEGRPLRQLIDGVPMAPSRAIELVVPMVRALAQAHASGLVHRDLKPENVFVTDDGRVKVLDFGIARAIHAPESSPRGTPIARDLALTGDSALVGTLPYMAPEQWGADEVDHRTDLYAAGVVLFELLAGRHPLAPFSHDVLRDAALRLDEPLPALGGVEPALADVVARCLRKRKAQRFDDAPALLAALEPFLPSRRAGAGERNPYPGLTAFREEDAELFRGRTTETARLVARLHDRALIGVVGPSGAGKSSLVRAGLIPELRRLDRCDVAITRPGRQPLASLAAAALTLSSSAEGHADDEGDELATRLRTEPGALGERLRRRARQRGARVLLFVDQFEELFTLVDDPALRRAYLACLLGAADDPLAPVRVVVSLRSDFLDRVGEDRAFIDALTPGLVFLSPPGPEDLHAALVEPARHVGYRFEHGSIADEMIAELAATAGALPLLQFAASCLWQARDGKARLLTRAAYQQIGGVAGALASHADAVVASLAPASQALTRRVFQRLVTAERTRDVVEVAELVVLSEDAAQLRSLLDHLVDARLLSIRAGAGPSTVEIVHESLIEAWPTLRRWLDEGQEDAAFLHRLRGAARPWDEAGRSVGLLWRGDAAEDSRRWRRRYRGELAARERDYLDAVARLADRAASTRRRIVLATIAVLALLVVAAAVALVWIRDAEQTARREADRARTETERTREANAKVEDEKEHQAKLRSKLEDEQVARQAASTKADTATQQVEVGRAELERTNEELRTALELAQTASQQAEADSKRAKEESERAKAESERARIAAEEARTAERIADEERQRAEDLAKAADERADRLERERGKIGRTLD